MATADPHPLILVTGATGYIGGRLYPRLLDRGFRVRCMAREPTHLHHRTGEFEAVRADVTDEASLVSALAGVDTAYYLIHSMGSAAHFEQADKEAAERFSRLAAAAGVRHIIYLGGLGEESADLSPHLRSRHEVGHILRSHGVPVTELRASIIIGSGSLSFEMIRALVERLPVMITPKWVGTMAQPIAIRDVLDYLIAAAVSASSESRVYEIGGADRMSYRDLMFAYADARGLKRRMISVPVITPRLSSLWLGLVTPVYARIGKKLVESLKHPTICNDPAALRAFPVQPMGAREAIREALHNEDRVSAETSWTDAMSSADGYRTWAGVRFGNRLIDQRAVIVAVPPEEAFRPIRRIGGRTGWYYADFLWRLRGWIDLLAGGCGMRRGRRDPEHVTVGDALDCWRVEGYEPSRTLLLRAEMKLPGRAWLEFTVAPEAGGSRITQTASFDPLGLAGILYWYAIYPLHELIFAGMLKAIARKAEKPE